MPFADSDEVRDYIGGVFVDAFADTEVGPKLRATGLVLGFVLSDPDTVLVVDTATGTVGDRASMPAPTATMTMSADIASAYWQGKVSLPLAMGRRQIKVEGSVAALLKLAPLSTKLMPAYVQRLEDDGRHDLLV
ncbi:SCP2 sterol-binding domain-containing protein [Nocardioides sp.]|uniref:SCP2 sterol-binding domain-containing protein n=1 Tax=Nocardioides sp. TaxID=35761 RepID=UPI0035170B4B